LARVRAARAGSTGLAEVLQAVAVEMTAELHQELGEQVEAAPTRLIVPLLAALLPPLLVLVLNPALQAFLDTLAGVGPMPLGG
jgi:pilus assembly protein TadC